MKKKIYLIGFITGVIILSTSCKKNKGCTDPEATNYNSVAKRNDGSCLYVWYEDADGDGQGNINSTTIAHDQPSGYVNNSTDGNDIAVQIKQRASMIYVGATWCPPCGTYGEPTKLHIDSKGSDAVLLSIQKGDAISGIDEFGPQFGTEFTTFAQTNTIPRIFFTGHEFTFENSGFYEDESYTNNLFDGKITSMLSKTPEIGIGAEAVFLENTVTVKTRTKFVSATGERWIGIYLLEDGVMAQQSLVGGSNAVVAHNNVLRTAANETFGLLKTSSLGTSFTAGQVVDGEYTITVNNGWNKDKLEVVVIVWEENSVDRISNSVKVKVN